MVLEHNAYYKMGAKLVRDCPTDGASNAGFNRVELNALAHNIQSPIVCTAGEDLF